MNLLEMFKDQQIEKQKDRFSGGSITAECNCNSLYDDDL